MSREDILRELERRDDMKQARVQRRGEIGAKVGHWIGVVFGGAWAVITALAAVVVWLACAAFGLALTVYVNVLLYHWIFG